MLETVSPESTSDSLVPAGLDLDGATKLSLSQVYHAAVSNTT